MTVHWRYNISCVHSTEYLLITSICTCCYTAPQGHDNLMSSEACSWAQWIVFAGWVRGGSWGQSKWTWHLTRPTNTDRPTQYRFAGKSELHCCPFWYIHVQPPSAWHGRSSRLSPTKLLRICSFDDHVLLPRNQITLACSSAHGLRAPPWVFKISSMPFAVQCLIFGYVIKNHRSFYNS